jgi:hypothetical protein
MTVKPFGREHQSQLTCGMRFKMLKSAKVTANNMPNNGDHLKSHLFQTAVGI